MPTRNAHARLRRVDVRHGLELFARSFAEHDLLTHASAIAFRALVALVPLVLFGLGLLAALGLRDTWFDSLAPPIQDRVTTPVFVAIDYTVQQILTHGSAGLIVFSGLLLLWDLAFAVRAIMVALNEVHGVDETRAVLHRAAVAVALAVVVGTCLVGSVLVVTVAPRVAGGALDVALGVARWGVAACLLALVVGLLVRYAPAERPEARWASAGSVLVVATWIGASLVFGWYVSSIANFKTPTGSLTVFLVLTLYVFVSCAIFVVGAQLDELARKQAGGARR